MAKVKTDLVVACRLVVRLTKVVRCLRRLSDAAGRIENRRQRAPIQGGLKWNDVAHLASVVPDDEIRFRIVIAVVRQFVEPASFDAPSGPKTVKEYHGTEAPRQIVHPARFGNNARVTVTVPVPHPDVTSTAWTQREPSSQIKDRVSALPGVRPLTGQSTAAANTDTMMVAT